MMRRSTPAAIERTASADLRSANAQIEVLLREHLRRGEQCALATGFRHREHRAHGYHCLAGPNLALKQSLHGPSASNVRGDVLTGGNLASGERIRQSSAKLREHAVPGGGAGLRHGLPVLVAPAQ